MLAFLVRSAALATLAALIPLAVLAAILLSPTLSEALGSAARPILIYIKLRRSAGKIMVAGPLSLGSVGAHGIKSCLRVTRLELWRPAM